jgi:hypothetical protein
MERDDMTTRQRAALGPMTLALLAACAGTTAAQDSVPGRIEPPSAIAVAPTGATPTEPPPDGAGVTAGAPASQAGGAADTGASDGFRVGGFTFKPGGRVKLDVIRDFKPIGNEDAFDTRTIPVDGSEGTNSNLHAKETRLSLDIRGDVEDRELRMYLETDFYGSSSVLRLRHAYGSWGGLLAGQTWSTFVDEDNMPRTIDFESPTAFASIRQAQVRWSSTWRDTFKWAVALEDNKSAITIPTSIPGKAEYPFPDFVGRLRWDWGSSHVTTAGFLGAARFRAADEDLEPDSVTLYGWMASAKFATFGRDYVYGVFTTGDGIGRYRGGTTAVPNASGELEGIGGNAFMGGYEHFWSDRWSTNGVYSVADTDDQDHYTSSINKQLRYGAVNLLYWFLGDRAWTGVEYIYGSREVFGDEGSTGSAHRLQYAVRFNLP